MPSLQDIEQFKSDLNAVGNEEEILEERGLTLEDVPPPQEGLSDDLSALLDIGPAGPSQDEPEVAAAAPPEAPAGPPLAPPEAPAGPPAADMEGVGDVEIADEETAPGETPPEAAEEAGPESFDIEGIYPDTDEEAPGDALPAETVVTEEPSTGLEPPPADDFEGISEAEYAGLTDSMDLPADDLGEIDFGDIDFGDEEPSVTPAEAPPAGDAGADEEVDAADFDETADDLGEIDFGDIDFGDEEPPVTPAEAPEDFGDVDFEAPAEEPEEIPADLAGPPDEEIESEQTPEEFSFEEGVDEFELPAEPTVEAAAGPEEGAAAGLEEAAADEDESEVGEEDFDLDDFPLGDLGDQFGVTEEETQDLPSEEELNPALAVSEQLPDTGDKLDLTDDQFEALQRTLAGLPRNLRIIIEEAVGEEQLSGGDLETLVDALVRGKSAKELANIAGRITGRRIAIPAAYEKRTGLEFEEEKGTFVYIFRYKVLPFARTAAIIVAILGLVSFLGYRFVYKPVKAAVLYNRGLAQIEDGGYLLGNELFDEAREHWPSRRRFFQYAESFIDQRRNDLAAEKYEELLSYRGFDKQGLLDYAGLETYGRAAYPHAEELLNAILVRDKYMYDFDALLQSGDNYMEWALEYPERYENARLAFATLIQKYGELDELMFRMLDYFIRTDNLKEVISLKDYFQSIKKIKLDAEVYAELGGYLVTRDETTGRSDYVSDAQEVLFRTMEEAQYLPGVHYHLSRLFRHLGNYGEEKTALAKAAEAYRMQRNRNILDETRFIDTMNRQGEAAFRDMEYLEAEDRYLSAKKSFEAAKNRGFLKDNEVFGRIYSNLGDVYYYVGGNYPAAMSNYKTSRLMGYSPPVLYYKMGYIHYRNEQYEDSLLRFYESAGRFSSNVNLMFATANNLYYQGLYSAAQGYYLHVLTDLETMRKNIPDLRPEERPEHRALLENLMRAYTNLGATLYRLSEKTGDTEKVTQALVNLTIASEYFDRITRDRNTLVRTESKNLSFLNTRAIIYPEPGFKVEIYNEIPRDLSELEF